MVIGATGQCGRAIVERLLLDGWQVTATTSGPLPDDDAGRPLRWAHLDRDPSSDLSSLAATPVDVVVQVAAFGPEHAEQLVRLGDRTGSVVVLSSVSVYTDAAGRSLDESTGPDDFPQWPVPIPIDWVTLAPSENTYSTRKVLLEQTLRERAPWPVTIIRPGAIHGAFSHHLREWYFIQRVLDGRRQVILPFRGESIFQPTAAVNLAELVALAANNPGDRTLHCGDLDPPTVSEISALVDAHFGWSTERVFVDGVKPAPTVGNHPWAVPRPVVVDMEAARVELGYQQVASYAESLGPTIEWALDACRGRDWRDVFTDLARYPDNLFDYDAEDAYLRTTRSTR
jgi:nucleoside-diphosphate-sugar epimerase